MESEQLCTPGFLRWISTSSAEKRTSVIQKVILHRVGERREVEVPKTSFLMQESELQHAIIVQAQKAVRACLRSDKFKFGLEHVEAQRILLLAAKRRDAILKELHRDEYKGVELQRTILDQLKISNLSFGLATTKQSISARWFVAVASCGTSVLATNATSADEHGSIRFEKPLKFEKLSSAFEIVISIYSLSTSQEHTQKSKILSVKAFPTYLKSCMGSCKYLNGQQIQNCSFEHLLSSFKLWGSITVAATDVRYSSNSTLKFLENPVSSLLLKRAVSLNLSRC